MKIKMFDVKDIQYVSQETLPLLFLSKNMSFLFKILDNAKIVPSNRVLYQDHIMLQVVILEIRPPSATRSSALPRI